jgi:hypothetical protein
MVEEEVYVLWGWVRRWDGSDDGSDVRSWRDRADEFGVRTVPASAVHTLHIHPIPMRSRWLNSK